MLNRGDDDRRRRQRGRLQVLRRRQEGALQSAEEGRPAEVGQSRRGPQLADLDSPHGPSDPGTIEALKAQAARQLADQDEWEGGWSDSGYVFTREDGEPYHPQFVSRSFERAMKAAKLPEISLHDLRHTHATLALRAGLSQGRQ
jgi:hypothetical protein